MALENHIQGWLNDLNMLLSCFREKMPAHFLPLASTIGVIFAKWSIRRETERKGERERRIEEISCRLPLRMVTIIWRGPNKKL